MLKPDKIAIFFLLILSSFIIAPSLQVMIAEKVSIVNINEIPEDEEKKNKNSTLEFRLISSKINQFQLHSSGSHFNRLSLFYYQAPLLTILNPPPEIV